MTDHDDIRDEDLRAPASLVEDLRCIYHAPATVAPRVDRAVARAAWRHFSVRRSYRWARVLVPLAAAAVLALVALPGRDATLSGDVDGDGTVDILDAFALARRIEASEPAHARWDFNRDDTVDGRDVDVIAAMAVSLR